MFPATTQRVPKHTDPQINEMIRNAIWQHVYQFAAAPPEAIDKRLRKLDREWDIERVLEFNAALVSLIGLALTVFVTHLFIIVPIAVAVLLLTHAVQGWCPPLPIFRRLGFRTACEIDQEKYALKALRGDFQKASDPTTPPPERAAAAFTAAEG
jgi:hypothetical protein